jgi:hypothetical protein
MADPSMDRKEFYVAASRTRGETFFYATPEIGFDRIEFAPAPPSAAGLEHIARAAEHDGSQAAAHDEALRQRLGQLTTEELFSRRRELSAEAGAERRNGERIAMLEERLAEARDRLGRPGSGPFDATRRKFAEESIEKLEAEAAEAPAVEYAARAEAAVASHLIEERLGRQLVAVRLDPPDYLRSELGERPSDPAKRQSWDRAAAKIEGYRLEHGIRDRGSALGELPKAPLARRDHRRARESIERAQRQLGLEQAVGRERSVDIGIGR